MIYRPTSSLMYPLELYNDGAITLSCESFEIHHSTDIFRDQVYIDTQYIRFSIVYQILYFHGQNLEDRNYGLFISIFIYIIKSGNLNIAIDLSEITEPISDKYLQLFRVLSQLLSSNGGSLIISKPSAFVWNLLKEKRIVQDCIFADDIKEACIKDFQFCPNGENEFSSTPSEALDTQLSEWEILFEKTLVNGLDPWIVPVSKETYEGCYSFILIPYTFGGTFSDLKTIRSFMKVHKNLIYITFKEKKCDSFIYYCYTENCQKIKEVFDDSKDLLVSISSKFFEGILEMGLLKSINDPVLIEKLKYVNT